MWDDEAQRASMLRGQGFPLVRVGEEGIGTGQVGKGRIGLEAGVGLDDGAGGFIRPRQNIFRLTR
jgi:hypothetical protein